jgi:hypothetical protein
MDHSNIITLELDYLEIDYDGRGRLQFELPPEMTDREIAYFKTLLPRVEEGLLKLVDPSTREIVFSCRPPRVLKPESPFARCTQAIVHEAAINLDERPGNSMKNTLPVDVQGVANSG